MTQSFYFELFILDGNWEKVSLQLSKFSNSSPLVLHNELGR